MVPNPQVMNRYGQDMIFQAEKDLEALKRLKQEEYPSNVLCPMCEKRGVTEVTKTTSVT